LVIIQKIFLVANSGGTPLNPIILNTIIFKTLGIVGTAGTFFNPNFMVDFLFPIIIISVTLIFRAELTKFIKTVLSLNAILMFIAVFLSGSRGGVIAFLISITLILLFSKKRIYLAIIPVFLTLFILIPNPLRKKIWKGTESDPYIYKRIDINKASLQMFLKKPIFGYGTGTYKNVARQFKFPVPGGASKYRMIAEQAHNEVAQFIVENGIVGGVFLLILVIWLIIMVILNRRKFDFYDYILIGIIVGLLAHSIVDFNLRVPGVFIPFMIFLAILLRKDEDDSKGVFFGGEIRWSALITLVFILLNVIIITNYIGVLNRNKGLEYFNEKNLDLATDKLFFATHLSHFDSEAHRLLGLCYMYRFYNDFSQINYEHCLAEFALAMRYDSISALIPFNIACFYENLYFIKISNDQKASYELNETISYYRFAIEREPTLVLYRYRLAKFLFRINRNKNALEELEIALNYEENYINAHLLKSVILRKLGQETEAYSEFKKATEIDKRFLDSKTLNAYDKNLLHLDEFLRKFFKKEDSN
ncbi:O-antigen ligase family protein, partial [Candidatus Dependentiae bacterium]|nr:O-antigen ligase family protein [Candidatus Dependentiae bacterium]